MRRSMLLALIVLLTLATLPRSALASSATPGDGQPVALPSAPTMGPQSTVSGTAIKFVAEYGKTSIFLRICADSPSFQMRSEAVGQWITEVFNRTDAAGGCSPSTTSWWRMVYNIDPNPGQVFRIYATANDTMLPESEFMRRAARTDCVVTAYATGYCTPAVPALVSAPNADVNEPGSGASVQGTINVSGWAIDAGSWSGPGVDQVQVYLNGVLYGTANYGQARQDVSNVFGDGRFAASGFTYSLDTSGLSGSVILQVRYRSAISGQWSTFDRAITVNNTTPNIAPNVPVSISPADGATVGGRTVTFSWQDAGDPDNGPRSYRDYYVAIRTADGSWSTVSGWQTATSWTVTLPNDGGYIWSLMAGDGVAAASTGERRLNVQTSSKILNVRYVDQVYVQRTPQDGYWNHCGPASTAMVLHYEGKEPRDVLTDRQATLDLVCSVKPNCYGGANVGMTLNTFRQRGLDAFTKWNPTLADIQASINAGHPMLMGIAQANHIVVVVGYQDGGRVVINDPFGGKNWWSVYAQRNDVGRNPSSPSLKGEKVSYVYGSELGGRYGIVIRGPAPARAAGRAAVNAQQGGALNGDGASFTFPGASAAARAAGGDIAITYTPHLTPTYQIDGYVASLATFNLSALDADSQPVAQFARPFSVTVQLDAAIVDAWGTGGDQSAREDGAAAASSPMRALSSDNLVLAGWSRTEGRWVELATTVDLGQHRVSAQSSEFTEFAVLVKPTYTIFMPLLTR